MKRKLSELTQDELETYYNLYYQKGRKQAKEYLKNIKTTGDTLLGLVPMFYNLALSSLAIDTVFSSLGKSWGQEAKHKVHLLGRKGLIVVKITDKSLEETYHPKSELKNIKLFVKRNNKWILDKENYFGIKTGAYELKRIYRRYYKKTKEEDVCPECHRGYEE